MHVPVTSPTNRFLIQQRDRRWPRVLSTFLVVSAVVLTTLSLVGWPRLKSTAIHYDLIRLRSEVAELRREEHRLATELELERSPTRLAERARELGLIPPPNPETTVAAAAAEVP